jgi:hypothetical protein
VSPNRTPNPAILGASVVAVGSFNPAIFSPAWFSLQELIPKAEADDALVEAILPGAAKFRLDWLEVTVLPNRLILSTNQPQSVRILRDLVVGTFQLLNHTPISAVGLNRDAHFHLESEGRWRAIESALISKHLLDEALSEPQTQSVRFSGSRTDDFAGQFLLTIEHSVLIQPGIYIGTNDHFDFDQESRQSGADQLVALLESEWDNSVNRSDRVWETVLAIS